MKTVTVKSICDLQDNYFEIPVNQLSYRPSVYGIIIKNNKIVLLSNKSNGKLWFPGGGIELGEKIEDALKREITEETGLEISETKFLTFKENFVYYKPKNSAHHVFAFFYLCQIKSEQNITNDLSVNDVESEKPRWISINDLTPEIFSDFNEEIYCLVQSLNKKSKLR